MPAATPKHKVDAGHEKVSNNEQALMKCVKQDQYCKISMACRPCMPLDVHVLIDAGTRFHSFTPFKLQRISP